MQSQRSWLRILGTACLAYHIACSVTQAQQVEVPSDQAVAQKRQEAKVLFAKGQEAESRQEYGEALGFYRRSQELFPNVALLHYRVGICQGKLGQSQDAIRSFRAFLTSGYDGDEAGDARLQLQALLLPTLTPEQRDNWEEAADNLEVAANIQRPFDPARSNPAKLGSLQKAIELLNSLDKELPEYLPTQARLGSAYQQMGDLRSAITAYDKYLKGFERLGFVPADRREIRKAKVTCEDMLVLKSQEADAQSKARMDQEERSRSEDRAVTAKKLEDAKAERRSYIEQHGSLILNAPNIGRNNTKQSISFDGDKMILTEGYPDGDVAKIKRTLTVTDIDPQKLRVQELEVNGVTWVWIELLPTKGVHFEKWVRNGDYSSLVDTGPTIPHGFDAPDEKAAISMMNALRELVNLSNQASMSR